MSSKSKNGRLPINLSRKFIINENTQFAITEAYKTARTNLMFSLATADSKAVVVTSCAPSEGKSTNCLNMAITMAEMGSSVLLIDADMRKPVQHSLLKLENKYGLSSILGSIVDDISKTINVEVRPNLDVLSAGPIPPNPAELLGSSRMEQLIDIVCSHYDYVFIDTPPVTVVTDALLMNDKIAGIVFVIKQGHTTHGEISDALSRVSMANGKMLGFLKVNCDFKGKGGYKYKYKYKYKNYKYGE